MSGEIILTRTSMEDKRLQYAMELKAKKITNEIGDNRRLICCHGNEQCNNKRSHKVTNCNKYIIIYEYINLCIFHIPYFYFNSNIKSAKVQPIRTINKKRAKQSALEKELADEADIKNSKIHKKNKGKKKYSTEVEGDILRAMGIEEPLVTEVEEKLVGNVVEIKNPRGSRQSRPSN